MKIDLQFTPRFIRLVVICWGKFKLFVYACSRDRRGQTAGPSDHQTSGNLSSGANHKSNVYQVLWFPRKLSFQPPAHPPNCVVGIAKQCEEATAKFNRGPREPPPFSVKLSEVSFFPFAAPKPK
jgi:hypothetical protein